MISCDEAVQRLWEYLENEATPETRAHVEEHLSVCRRCCGEARFAEELQKILAGWTETDLPDDVGGRLQGFLDEMEAR